MIVVSQKQNEFAMEPGFNGQRAHDVAKRRLDNLLAVFFYNQILNNNSFFSFGFGQLRCQ